MDDKEIRFGERVNWYRTGFKLGIGFVLAIAVLGGLGTLATDGIATNPAHPLEYGMRSHVHSDTLVASTVPASSTSKYRSRHIDARSDVQCLQETAGVFDERYQRCISGYDVIESN